MHCWPIHLPQLQLVQLCQSKFAYQRPYLNWLHRAQVYVILFGVGSTDTEGIYSLRVMSREERLPQDTIIAFSTKEDAER